MYETEENKNMKRKIVGIVVLMLVATTVVSATNIDVKKSNNKIVNFEPYEPALFDWWSVDQKNTHQDGAGFQLIPTDTFAQSFTPTKDKLTAVSLYIFKYNTTPDPVQITVSIRDNLTGSDLVNKTIDTSVVTIKSKGTWVLFDFEDISITPGSKYFIVCSGNKNFTTGVYCWFFGYNDTYIKGEGWIKQGETSDWVTLNDFGYQEADMCFKTYFRKPLDISSVPKNNDMVYDQSCGNRGGLFTQLPSDPGFSGMDWWAYASAIFMNESYQDYEMFTDVAGPIQGIHWWGMSCKNDDPTYLPGDTVGMTFNITFYKDNNTTPGEMVLSFSNIEPSITATGVLYQDVYSNELYFFEYDLPTSCNLSAGWVSIFNTGSDNNCSFFWFDSSTGESNAFETKGGERWDFPPYGFSLVLTDGTKTSLEIVDMKGGFGVSLGIKNNGNTTVDNFPVNFLVIGGILKKIEVNAREPISGLAPGDIVPLKTGIFFGLGKITIFVVGDGIIDYKQGKQLFIYTIL
jgi:hypothetical protein